MIAGADRLAGQSGPRATVGAFLPSAAMLNELGYAMLPSPRQLYPPLALPSASPPGHGGLRFRGGPPVSSPRDANGCHVRRAGGQRLRWRAAPRAILSLTLRQGGHGRAPWPRGAPFEAGRVSTVRTVHGRGPGRLGGLVRRFVRGRGAVFLAPHARKPPFRRGGRQKKASGLACGAFSRGGWYGNTSPPGGVGVASAPPMRWGKNRLRVGE